MPSGTADEVIFGSPELTDFFWTPEVLGKQVSALHLSDAHEDEEEERAEQRQTTTANHLTIALPSATAAQTAFPSEQDLDTEGSDLLNLISTSLDRFNAQLHHTEEGTDSQQLSQQPVQQQHQPPHDCGIPIPVAYSQVSAHINPLSENFSNSVMRAWATASDCPPCSISALASSSYSSSQHATAGTAQLFSKESTAAPTAAAAAAVSKNAKILPSPPGLPRLPTANHLFEIASTSSTNDSNSTRSRLDAAAAAAAAVATAERRRSPNTCSSLSETPLWDSQWGQFPAEPCVQSTDSGFDSEHAFAWWSSASQTASEQSDLQRGCSGGSGDDPHGSLDCGFNRAGGSCSTDSGLPCFNGHPLDDQLLMQEVKAVVAAAAAAAAAAGGTFNSSLDVPNPTTTSPALRSALWASWPLSSTGGGVGGGGISSSSVSSCCFFDSYQRQQVDHTASHSSPGMPSGMSSLARYETANELLQQQQRQQPSPSFQLTARRKAASLSSASTGPPRGLFPTNLSCCGGPRSPSGGRVVGQLGSPPSQPRQHHNNHHSHHNHQQQQSYEMQHARHNTKALGPGSQKLGSKGRDQASRINQFSAKPLSASLGSNCTSLDDGGYFSPGGLKTGGVGGGGGHPRKGVATAGVSESGANSSDGGKPVIAKWRRACSFYLRGHCKKEDCEFAHDLTKVTCKFWELGECFKGSTCPFLHGYPPELLDGSNVSTIPSLLSLGPTTTSSKGTPVS